MKIFRAAQIPSEAGDTNTFTGEVIRTTLASDIMPHAGAWHEGGVREEAEDLNQPLLTLRASASRPASSAPSRCLAADWRFRA